MNPSKRFKIRKIVIIPVILVLAIALAVLKFFPTSSNSTDLSARLSEIIGVVDARNTQQDPFNQVNDGFILKSAMQLQTKEQSKVRLDLSTGSILRLGPTTVFSLASQANTSTGVLSTISLTAGKIWIVLQGGSLNVNTPGGLASVRGSYMSVWVEPSTNRVTICCLEGSCGFTDNAGDVDLTSGQKVVSSSQNVLPGVQKMDPSDIQDWINNSPESATVVPQIINLLATVTPTLNLTPAVGVETVTVTPTPTSTSTPTSNATGASTLTTALPSTVVSPTSTPTVNTYFPTASQAVSPPRGASPTPPAYTATTAPTAKPTATQVPPTPLPTATQPPAPTSTQGPTPYPAP